MSRAFVKELEDAAEPLPVIQRPETTSVTSAGLARLRARLANASDDRERAALEDRLASAVVVQPPDDEGTVAFGATVAVAGVGKGLSRFTIVDDRDGDVASGRIGEGSPLAQALLGAHVGDQVVWHRPAGDRIVTVRKIAYGD